MIRLARSNLGLRIFFWKSLSVLLFLAIIVILIMSAAAVAYAKTKGKMIEKRGYGSKAVCIAPKGQC